jgi:aspartate/methionine/tyrosine aminotransferase
LRSRIHRKACTKIQGQVTSGANSIAQRATITAVDADPSVLQHMVDAFHSRRDLVVGLLKEIPGIKINVPGAFMYSQTYLRSSKNIKRNFNKRR